MSYLLWHGGDPSLASPRRLFSPDEVVAFDEVHQLCAALAEERAGLARDAQRAREEARAAGLAQGLAEGRAAGLAEAARASAAVLAAAQRAITEARDAGRDELAMLALQIARKLLGQLPAAERLVRLAQEAARQSLPGGGALVLRVHPAHEDEVRAVLAAMTAPDAGAPGGAGAHWSVQGDAALPFEACRLSGASGDADATLDVQLDRLARGWGLK